MPQARRRVVHRPRLVERLDAGLSAGHKLTLVSAPAGFGKTTLLGEWVAGCARPVAWLSLDQGDSDPTRFLTYLVAAFQTVAVEIGEGLLDVLQAPQAPPIESTLTALLNDIASASREFVLVLDDYHALDSKHIDDALTFIVEHAPPQAHLVIATREDPSLPLARWRVSGRLTEVRAGDLRFTPSETADFLGGVMGVHLSDAEVAALDARTEGWVAGLQLAAISVHGTEDVAGFIKSFTGSHPFVLDYLIEEVLQRQAAPIQTFLLRTSILDRLCGPLCDAVVGEPAVSGQQTLEYLDRANLFIVPLDKERRWYRYHHLFGDLLRQRLSFAQGARGVAELHIRASEWYEQDEQLRTIVLQSLALHLLRDRDQAAQVLAEALALAEPGGFIRLFVDEGPPMARLLREAHARGVFPEHVRRLLAAFPADEVERGDLSPDSQHAETLSKREIEVLVLIAQGLTNQEIATRLYLSLHTAKVHARNINSKLGVGNRTQAVARARVSGLLSAAN